MEISRLFQVQNFPLEKKNSIVFPPRTFLFENNFKNKILNKFHLHFIQKQKPKNSIRKYFRSTDNFATTQFPQKMRKFSAFSIENFEN